MNLDAVDVVVAHPRLRGLGRDGADQERAEGFARDLARWFVGGSADDASPLVRVITMIAGREFRDTRWLCRDRPLLAVEAAARATEALWPLLRDPPALPPAEEPPAPPEGGDGGGAGDEGEQGPPAGAGSTLGGALGEAGASGDPALDDLIARVAALVDGADAAVGADERAADALGGAAQAAADAAFEADDVVRQIEQLLPGVGWSTAPGQLEMTLLDRLEQLATLLARLPELRRLADLLGRVEDARRRDGPTVGGREEVVGVRLGGDVSTALPFELGLLGDAETEDLFAQRFVERRLVCLELTGRGDEGSADGDRRGPLIACIDTSASMEGPPELAAKALVLAVCRAAIPRGRAVHLLLFGGRGERSELRIRRGLGGLEGLLGFLELRFSSGTDFDGPLLRALELLDEQELDRADVLVVTDGLCRPGPSMVDKVADARARRGLRVWSVLLGQSDVRGVAPFSDEVLAVDLAGGGANQLFEKLI